MLNVYLHCNVVSCQGDSTGRGFALELASGRQIELFAHANRIPLRLKTRYYYQCC
jgi:hypothetical protein